MTHVVVHATSGEQPDRSALPARKVDLDHRLRTQHPRVVPRIEHEDVTGLDHALGAVVQAKPMRPDTA